MSVLSVPIPRWEASVAGQASPPGPEKALTANEVSGYRVSMGLECAFRKRLAPISENARSRISMSQELSAYSNSEFAYAIFPIAIDFFFLGQRGREIVESKPLSMIFTILTHCLNTKAINNYYVRTKGRWFCQDAMIIESSPLAPLADFGKFEDAPNPRLP